MKLRARSARALAGLVLVVGTTVVWNAGSAPVAAIAAEPLQSVVPVPASVQAVPGAAHTLNATTKIYTTAAAHGVGDHLAGVLRPSTGYPFPVEDTTGTPADGVALLIGGAPSTVGDQGYQLTVAAAAITLRANTAAGLFAGVQTLRQLLPGKVESATPQTGPWTVPGATITDHPRFTHRGAMLDVARHFHPVATVKRYLDQLALYKVNYFHLHLTDDQGWRIVVDSWPKLATHGGSTQVGGGPGGYYTKAQYQEIVAYAAARHITVIPEVDLPGHTNAALASYAELNCNGVAPGLRTDIAVGYSSLCVSKDITYKFVEDVIREIAELTPGPYFHIGGDEASATTDQDYQTFMNKVLPLVAKYGKKPMGWHEFIKTTTDTAAVPQYWGTTTSNAVVQAAAARGAKVLMSPANKAYLDMKYNPSTPLGLSWAGMIEVQDAYNWNPGTHLSGVPETAVRGVEAPLWTETIVTPAHIDFMAFPRLAAIAELGWSPWSTHNWDAFKVRLGAQAPRWTARGIEFYRSTQVPWDNGGTTTTTTTTTSGVPSGSWAPWIGYATDAQVTYNGGTYRCRQPHTSQPGWEPTNVPALWQRV
ncbi:family 20 glycosylhydrolase [Actinosynnema sp. NPDC047251]|uniref:beta-N-acetylhexosaminidase n=1 Tax=Saccharothrix espanaensis (strain ATCC 51144 / DSM 44229 / JCM 9112 / NBRC 15066 / NRRL 15764) TaxID=1179773 RepID=K0JRP7_SACES|nr:family 20 glycosylhydrolase [Saccharothrix espanaensis]CCH28461.1 beta-hexosaminidase [Saccharothrix espanaensis DSM 44229]